MKTLQKALSIKTKMIELAKEKVNQTPLAWLNPSYDAINYSKVKVTLCPHKYSDFPIVRKEIKKIAGKKSTMTVTGQIQFLLKISY